MVLRTDLRTILTIDKEYGSISYVEGSKSCTHEIIRTRTVNDVELLIVPFYVIYG